MMSEPFQTDPASLSSNSPEGWAPPPAPLEMPAQTLERDGRGFDLAYLIRLILPGQHV